MRETTLTGNSVMNCGMLNKQESPCRAHGIKSRTGNLGGIEYSFDKTILGEDAMRFVFLVETLVHLGKDLQMRRRLPTRGNVCRRESGIQY